MNGELVKKVAICTLGFAIGAGAGFALSSFIYDNVVEDDEWLEGDEDEEEPEEQDVIETTLPDIRKKRDKKRKDYTTMYQTGQTKPDLEALVKNIQEELEDEEPEELDESPDPTKPYLITREGYEEEFLTHQKVIYHYYEDDDILTEAENEKIITANPEKFLGPDALDSFGKQEADPDFVHVRNEVLGVDYEIQMIHHSYAEVAVASRKLKVSTRNKSPKAVPAEEEDDE